ncbi:uncharacterized protein LOC127259356 isoform X2 [Andrographis paniculata]|uniref:uncharacterized protein LOC127259356 isoform X2 n=1 Tax=Andrographis paniculata TaxID=175694 RepID=UPI0021E95CDB|nr:uncharacterized protein LOC127259356 isoform X2 [Andrographis paniculata]
MIAIHLQQEKSSSVTEPPAAEKQSHLHVSGMHSVEATSAGPDTPLDCNGSPEAKETNGAKRTVVRRSERLKSPQSGGVKAVMPVVSHTFSETDKGKAPHSQQVSTYPILNVKNLGSEPQIQQDNTVPDMSSPIFMEKIDYLVQSVDEFKSQGFERAPRNPDNDCAADLNYKTLYLDSQKKIDALVKENIELVKKLEYARGKVAAHKHNSSQLVLVSRPPISAFELLLLELNARKGGCSSEMGSLPLDVEKEILGPLDCVTLGTGTSNDGCCYYDIGIGVGVGKPLVLSLVSTFLEKAVEENERRRMKEEEEEEEGAAVSAFQGSTAPCLSIEQYMERIYKYSCCSPCCFVMAQIYVDRFLQHTNLVLTSLNVHRLLITAVMLAAKFMDDAFFNNAYYARVGGVSTRELNNLEMKFLFSMDFRLLVSVQTFKKYCWLLKRQQASASALLTGRPPIPITTTYTYKDNDDDDDSVCCSISR